MVEKGFSIIMEGCSLKQYDKKKRMVLKSAITKNKIWKASLKASESQCLYSSIRDEESWFCHKRYGHLNFRSLGKLNTMNLVEGLPKIVTLDKSCEMCMLGKQSRLPFVNQLSMRAKHVLNVVSSDICGPFETLSCGESNYFISFVDEFSTML